MKMIKIALILMFTALFADAKMFQSVEPEKAILLQSGKNKLYCSNCGMNLIDQVLQDFPRHEAG